MDKGKEFVAQRAQMPFHVAMGMGAAPTEGVQSYPIPIALTGRTPVIISGPFPLSEQEWIQFNAVLNAMKPVLVGTPEVGSESSLSEGVE